ncbi:hypothetical protein PHLGIDRAFT_366494 [Phlebiopsis gigantea 11061_1 CR5-6]|uniref:Uncharacterized protein n=1 Tax=Phlebiopsis gigantea (strain 11061_1 CR5-6) TaxID=745531 RepID=A0A0C3S0Z9_PHLG1|nr:hypothetical protein PHLGIDRAFT_366494 [Phlebiopsis gigantea 11061_1 CR5-6]
MTDPRSNSTPHTPLFCAVRCPLKLSKAVDIPDELIANIVECTVYFQADASEADIIRLRQRALGTLSLVCRQWMRRLRRRIFNVLTIRSKDDLKQLLHFLDHPGTIQPTLAECLHPIRVSHTGSWGLPWLHLTRTGLVARHAKPRILIVTLGDTTVPYIETDGVSLYAPSIIAGFCILLSNAQPEGSTSTIPPGS